jgi:uncharacterized protein
MEEPPPNPPAPSSFLGNLWEREIAQPLRQVDDEARAFNASPTAHGVDRKVITVLVAAAVLLTLQHYLDSPRDTLWALRTLGLDALASRLSGHFDHPEHGRLAELMPFFAMQAFNCLTAMLLIRFVLRESVLDYGVKLRGFAEGWWIYLLMLAIIMPFVVYVSYHQGFRDTYPYYRVRSQEPLWPYFWLWEFAYVLQFFFLEFFFRGFMVHGTRQRFGCYSIFVMTVPYCMIHFGKPLPETLGSIVAGITLGFMSLKTRSIWLGTAVHVTVAVTMDMLALSHQQRFGG